jgi:hypothetical protein
MVSQQFASIIRVGMTTLSNSLLFFASPMFHDGNEDGGPFGLCAGCTNLGLVIESWTDLNPIVLFLNESLHILNFEL